MIAGIVTDIEGTTSSIAFVKDVLFPYARARLPDFVKRNAADPEVRRLLSEVSDLCGRSLTDDAAIAELLGWIDENRKATPLKALQGLIWDVGYRRGDFHGHVYADAAAMLREWKARGIRLAVYSSGSVHAQRLLFGHTEYGDLTTLFTDFFDTRIGPKQEAASYRSIAERMALAPAELMFLSDVGAELDAARCAGFHTCQLVRAGTAADPGHPHAADFHSIVLP
jgi:enolase-phosphatase E1